MHGPRVTAPGLSKDCSLSVLTEPRAEDSAALPPPGLAGGRRIIPKCGQVSLTALPYCHPQGDVPLQPSARVSMSEKNGMQVLEIQEVNQDDVGVYTCMVVNGSGKASMSAELCIQGINWWGGLMQDHRSWDSYPLEGATCSLHIWVLHVSHLHVHVFPGARSRTRRKEVGGSTDAATEEDASLVLPHSTPCLCLQSFLLAQTSFLCL